ncbi:hypothetical protein [Flammeovirga sp. SJP92]|uniref:hypothetical protein n=1 Tax=Flammeovirga sp. SJP92 TaxID=1775430 RepID=UPI0012F8117D|nr:hypothetical protein [Flammeovirga sp. SJP92]
MKEKTLTIIALLFSLFGCKNNDAEHTNSILKEKFQGQYEIVSATSDVAVDLNMDGKTSRNLLEENVEIVNAGISLMINENSNLFTEHWPIEYIGVEPGVAFDSTKYYPSYTLDYARYAITSLFQFDDSQKVIDLINPEPVISNGVADARFVFPDQIDVEDDLIIVTSTRNLYTFKGYVKTQITAKYKRYTTIL